MGIEDLPFLMLPRDYRERIKRFYEQDGKEKVKGFSREVEEKYKIKFRTIIWNEEQGLRSLSYTPGA
ncbi:MAG: hypothetical protein KJ559_04135 [Nanoarchaeota archaeon]|nr:hypothetical protein [Nanoarchaeota archaeon]